MMQCRQNSHTSLVWTVSEEGNPKFSTRPHCLPLQSYMCVSRQGP